MTAPVLDNCIGPEKPDAKRVSEELALDIKVEPNEVRLCSELTFVLNGLPDAPIFPVADRLSAAPVIVVPGDELIALPAISMILPAVVLPTVILPKLTFNAKEPFKKPNSTRVPAVATGMPAFRDTFPGVEPLVLTLGRVIP